MRQRQRSESSESSVVEGGNVVIDGDAIDRIRRIGADRPDLLAERMKAVEIVLIAGIESEQWHTETGGDVANRSIRDKTQSSLPMTAMTSANDNPFGMIATLSPPAFAMSSPRIIVVRIAENHKLQLRIAARQSRYCRRITLLFPRTINSACRDIDPNQLRILAVAEFGYDLCALLPLLRRQTHSAIKRLVRQIDSERQQCGADLIS